MTPSSTHAKDAAGRHSVSPSPFQDSFWRMIFVPVREAFSATFTGKVDGEAVPRAPLHLLKCVGFLLIGLLLSPIAVVLFVPIWFLWIVCMVFTMLARFYAGNNARFDADGITVFSRRQGRTRVLPWTAIREMRQSMDGPVVIWNAVMSDGEIVPLPMASGEAVIAACTKQEISLDYRFRRR